ncbi:MAG: FAD-binding oxidoreductase [Deltaproteobacteria bacterium]|nr:FAD-binding oxidoreductase [Deltaproteobacteria bacterium]
MKGRKKMKDFYPDFIENKPAKKSYRSIFKWGAKDVYKHPNIRMFKMLKEQLNMSDDDFTKILSEGNDVIELKNQEVKISSECVEDIKNIAGVDNVSIDSYDRVKYSHGQTVEEALALRDGEIAETSDLVVHPKNKLVVKEIVAYCNDKNIPVYVYGGGSSVNLGFKPVKGGITLVMKTHMNKVIELNEENQTVTVESGIFGPDYENILNNAKEIYGTKRDYTCGHFPQSFEFSTVGGWIAALGSGQQSSYYGDMYDIVLSQEYVTPKGNFSTIDFPATATGPKINDILKGSEGAFGVCVSATLKIFRYTPENRQRFSFIMPSWEDAVKTTKEISQGEFGNPAMLRISDAEETDVALKLYGVEGTIFDKIMSFKGYKKMERCLLLGHTEGEKGFAKNIKKRVKKIAKRNGGLSLTGYPVKKWEHGRFTDPYLRDSLQDFHITIDTLETSVKWDNLHQIHENVRSLIKKRPETICMTHASHFYPQGTNLYFIFIGKYKTNEEYKEFQKSIIEKICMEGGSLSHHHGVGKMIGPWMKKHLGNEQMEILKTLKKHFDPNNIMNPGGTLGLD